MSFQVAGGQAVNRNIFAADDLHDIDYKKIFAANVSLGSNDFGTVRIGYTEADINTNISARVNTFPFGTSASIPLNQLDAQKGKFTSVGYQYDDGTWITSNEWTSLIIERDGEGSTEAFYLMGGRRFGDFLAHVTYAQLDKDQGRQTSWTYGLNYNITPTVILKSEYKRVDTRGNGSSGVFVEKAQESYDHAVYAQSSGLGGSPSRNYDGDIISVGVDFVF